LSRGNPSPLIISKRKGPDAFGGGGKGGESLLWKGDQTSRKERRKILHSVVKEKEHFVEAVRCIKKEDEQHKCG